MLTSGADGLSFTADGRTERVMGEADSGNLFAVLGVDAAVGRTFSQEIVNGAWGPEAVLSYDFWERRFGGDAGIVGKTIQLNGYPFTVVGISSRGFFGTSVGFSPEIRFPKLPDSLAGTMPAMHLLDPIDYDDPFVGVMARLRPGVTAQQAQAATEVMYQQYVAAHPEITKRVRYRAAHVLLLPGARGGSWMRDEFGRPFFLLMVVVGTVLLIACANIASLLIARSMARRPEIAVRLAIGAGRARLFRQLLTETVLLSVLGGALGIAFAYSLNEFLFGFLPQTHMKIVLDVQPDLRALAFTFAVSLLTGILFGLAPALQATKTDLVSAIKGGRTGAGGGLKLGNLLIVSEVALSLVLLIVAGLFVRTFQNLKAVRGGFEAENVLLFTMKPVHERYSADRLRQLCRELIERVESLPGAHAAALSESGPFSRREGSRTMFISKTSSEAGEGRTVITDVVSPRFFESLGIPFLTGRDFTFSDTNGTRKVAIIDENAARDFFGQSNPVGRQISIKNDPNWNNAEIVGVVKSTKHETLKEPPQRAVYFSILQIDKPWMPTLFVRAAGNPSSLIAAVRQQFQALDQDLPVFNIKTFRQQVNESMAGERLIATLSGFFGLLAALLVAIGLYGMIAYSVTRRTREIGIRMAVGADTKNVRWMVMKETLLLVALGLLPGLLASLVATRLIASQLFGVSPTDWLTQSAATVFLVAVAALAGSFPARRASRIDPMTALRYE
jgi:predicted permease